MPCPNKSTTHLARRCASARRRSCENGIFLTASIPTRACIRRSGCANKAKRMMTEGPRLLFKSQRHTARFMHDGSLVVTRNRKGGGRRLRGRQAAVWVHAIETALDAPEAGALCRGFLNG